MKPAGKCEVRLVNPADGKCRGEFMVVENAIVSILWLGPVEQMGLIAVNKNKIHAVQSAESNSSTTVTRAEYLRLETSKAAMLDRYKDVLEEN